MTALTTNERTPQSAEAAREQPPEAQVVRSAGIVLVAVLLSRLTGLVREIVMANRFGAGFAYDSFLLGFRIPNLTRDLFAEGALSSAFIPAFASSLIKPDKIRASELANLVTSAIIAIVGAVCLLGMWMAPHLVWLLAPGFAGLPEKFALAVRLTRIMFPFLLLVALAAQSTGMLNSHGSFGVPAIASIFFNIGSVGFGLLIGYVVGPYLGIAPIEGMAYGVVAGGVLQLAWQRAKLRRLGYRFRFAWNWSNPGLRRIGSLMTPAIIGNLAVQVSLIISTNFASQLSDPLRGPNGPVSWLGYALRFVQVPLALFGVAMASALLPSIARSAAVNNLEEFRKTLANSLGTVFLLTIPSSLILIALGKPFIGVVYQSGHFNSYDTAQTGLALSCYAAGLVGFCAHRVLNPAFFALSAARTAMLISFSSIAVYSLFPLLLLRVWHLGFWALALTSALAAVIECLLLAECLRRKLGGLEGRYLLNSFLRIAGASAVMFFPLAFMHRSFFTLLPQTRLGYAAELAISLPLALALFFTAARVLGVEETRFVYQSFVAPTWIRIAGLTPLSRAHVKIQG
jgi:putative peptidoglycan lipid II flippase